MNQKICFNSTQSLVCTGCNDVCSTGEAFILVITLDCCSPSADMVHPPPMQVKFLGTCTSPLLTRNYSSLLVKWDHETVMVDCGEGTQRQLLLPHVNSHTKLAQIRTILITHLHPDHILGLTPLIFSMMGLSASVPKDGKPRDRKSVV